VHRRPEVRCICEQHTIPYTVCNIASLKVFVSNGKRPELESLQVPCHSAVGTLYCKQVSYSLFSFILVTQWRILELYSLLAS
jgi:hypothetical protein